MMRSLLWSEKTVENPAVQVLLKNLESEYPISKSGDGLPLTLRVEKNSKLHVEIKPHGITIIAPELSMIARGIGIALSENSKAGFVVEECSPFKTRGIMLDCSRCAVMKPEYIKQWLRKLALLDYNMLMLYTKDTYKLPGEEYFGYLRGAYTVAELQDIDRCAQQLGIEMVGAIQALGHLEPVLKWPAYNNVRDTISVLLTSEDKTYELIGKMLDFYTEAFQSRRIHLGMDETFGLGRGRYMNLNGFCPAFDIYNNHLACVMELCDRRRLKPMIWSDMYFRMGSRNMDYYDMCSKIPEAVSTKIPPKVQLVYWDYYHDDEVFYREWIRRHQAIGHQPVMASGIWTWPELWYNHRKTSETITPCISACMKEKVDKIVFTMWGDDGGYCDWSSAWAGVVYVAERLFNGNNEPDANLLEKRFAALCHGNYKDHLVASELSFVGEFGNLMASALLWDDPLLGIYWKEKAAENTAFWPYAMERFKKIKETLIHSHRGKAGDMEHALRIAALLWLKTKINLELYVAYNSRDTEKLQSLCPLIQEMIKLYQELAKSFRKQWYDRCKTFGFEVIQNRLAGLAARYEELYTRLKELLAGEILSIPEFEEMITNPKGALASKYDFLATASVNSVTTL